MSAPAPLLARYRHHRPGGIALFVFLVLLVGGERRLADAYFNLRSTVPGIENDDVLDGDEVRVRLIALNDDKAPTLPDGSAAVTLEAVHGIVQHLLSLARGYPAPRGPPPSRRSHA